MRLQPLLLCKDCGFKPISVGYSYDAIGNGRHKFASEYLEKNIACKRVMFIEQINAPTAIGGIHRRAPVPVVVYGTKAQIEIIQDPFIVQVTNEPFQSEKAVVKAWLRVGGTIGETRSTYTPFLIVRDSPDVALSRVDTFFRPVISKLQREMNYGTK